MLVFNIYQLFFCLGSHYEITFPMSGFSLRHQTFPLKFIKSNIFPQDNDTNIFMTKK